MSKRRKAFLITLPILLLCAVCAAPWAYIAYRHNQEYQADVDRLYKVARKLGYSDVNHIRFYRVKTGPISIDWKADILTLVFYSTDSIKEFSEKVDSLQFDKRFYDEHNAGIASGFLEWYVNPQSPEYFLTLNNYYAMGDFDNINRPPPNITDWILRDTQGQQRVFTIYNAQKPKDDDIWLLGGQSIPGNIVVMQLDR